MQWNVMRLLGAYLAVAVTLGALGGLGYAAHTCKRKCERTCGCGAKQPGADDEDDLEMMGP